MWSHVSERRIVAGFISHPAHCPFGMAKPGPSSAYEHSDEVATAGYYSVLLKDYAIKAEMTATPRVAFQRYTFPAGNESHILFDIGHQQGESGHIKDAFVTLNNDGTVEGWVVTLPVLINVAYAILM